MVTVGLLLLDREDFVTQVVSPQQIVDLVKIEHPLIETVFHDSVKIVAVGQCVPRFLQQRLRGSRRQMQGDRQLKDRFLLRRILFVQLDLPKMLPGDVGGFVDLRLCLSAFFDKTEQHFTERLRVAAHDVVDLVRFHRGVLRGLERLALVVPVVLVKLAAAVAGVDVSGVCIIRICIVNRRFDVSEELIAVAEAFFGEKHEENVHVVVRDEVQNRVDGDPYRLDSRKFVVARREQWECEGFAMIGFSEQHRFPVRAVEVVPFALVAAQPLRADGVDDPLGRQIVSVRDHGFAYFAPVRVTQTKLAGHFLLAGGYEDRFARAAALFQYRVRRQNNSVDVQFRDVVSDES